MAFSLTSTGVRLDGTTLRAKCKTDNGKLVDSALDLNMSISNNNGNFYLPGGMFGASASDILLNGSTLHAVLLTIQQVKVRSFIDLNVCIGNINGALTFVKPSQRITQSCSATFLEGSILKGLCLGSDGKLHPSTIDLNGCYSNDDGRFVAGSKVFDTARMIRLVPGGGKTMLRGQLLSRHDGWRNEEVHHLSLFVLNIDGKFSFAKGSGPNVLPLSARIRRLSALLCFWAPFFGGPLAAVVGAGIITPIGIVVESAITSVINDPVLKGEYEEAVVGRFICDTIVHMLVDGGAELLAEAVGTLAGLDVETAVAEVRGVFRGAKVEVAELGSYRLLTKVVAVVCRKETPKDWLETLDQVEKLEQA